HGFLAWDDAMDGRRPGVLVVHEWWGLNDYARDRARQLAEMGYVAFAADMYGEGKIAEHPQEAGAMASQVRENVDAWRRRGLAALEQLAQDPHCDKSRLAAIGYCFGGTTALQLAFAGADLDAVVTFHGALVVPTNEETSRVKGTILVCHGARDDFIPESTIQEFRQALDAGKVDWSMSYYGGAQHSFSVKSADGRGVPGLAYDPRADARSWRAMRSLFEERLGHHDAITSQPVSQ
ncbi:MAG TPA: dienelactone hydrolase family protein, partial [Pirellulaceae bacterium]